MPTARRRFHRPYKVRWNDVGTPRIDSDQIAFTRSYHQFGSLVERITRVFFAMEPDTVDKVLASYREKYGDGAYAYARRTLGSWRQGQVRHVGQTMMRLLEFVPMHADTETKFEIVRIFRDETLRRLRQIDFTIALTPEDSLDESIERLREIIDIQAQVELPPDLIMSRTWLSESDAILFQTMIRDGEKMLHSWQLADFIIRLRLLQRYRREIEIPAKMLAVFELPTARITFRIVQSKTKSMESSNQNEEEQRWLAQWSNFELESRFKSGEVSYPEYVLRNMDQFFTKEEQSELHKIAAMHGLELERLLMEIQIKSRTSEADLEKLLTTLKTLKEKGIKADVISRHETPSGHIEISARSRGKLWGCLPWFAILGSAFLMSLTLVIAWAL